MNKNDLPLVSIIIVNYNGKKYVEHCVRSVLKANYPNLEVIVADNGSTDGSIENLIQLFGNDTIKIIQIGENEGPAFARNRGVDTASGKYIAFLDNDTEPEPDWLNPLVETMEKDTSIGACQCKLLLMKERNRLDYAGDYISNLGFLVQRVTFGEFDNGQADTRDEILSAKSAAMIIRSDTIKEIGGFDESYFIYVEETDLAWRAWLKGYRIIFVPESRVYHEFGTSIVILGKEHQGDLIRYHGTKNYVTTLIKNFGFVNLIKVVPVHITLWIILSIYFLLKGQVRDSKNIIKGIVWTFFNIRSILAKRKMTQKMRIKSDKEIMPIIMKKRGLKYFYKKVTNPQK